MTADHVRVDLHVKTLNERVVRRAKASGIDVLVYAPHFTRLPSIRERAAEFSDEELLVVPGRELFTGSWRRRCHVLAVGLSEPVPDFVSLEATMAELDRQGAAVLAPHPEFLNVSLSRDQIDAYDDVIDAVETYNPKHLPWENGRAERIAESRAVEPFGSSYAHLSTTVGEVWTAFERPIEDTDDLVAALQSEVPRAVGHRDGVGHRLRCLAEFAHLGYENSVEKLTRIVLSGMEPTHPGHVAYGGRFDDCSVY